MSKERSFTNPLSPFKMGLFALCILFLSACAEGNKKADETEKDSTKTVEKKNSNLLEMEGKVFSIPSPIQTAFLLKKSGAEFTPSLLNPTSNVDNYATTDAKAINMGIYAADLAYATIYGRNQEAISYMAVNQKLATGLGLQSLFNNTLINRFKNNIGNEDSLLVLVSEAFKNADHYLKSNKQNDVSVMILAGGWIESLHLATSLVMESDNEAVKSRIGEQKITIDNLIQLLLPYSESKMAAQLVNELNELKDIFAEIKFTYTYEEAETKADQKLTLINSKSTVEMTKEQLQAITTKVEEIRNNIIH